MIKIKSLDEAEIGDYINHRGKISIISSIESKGEYYIIGITEGEVIVVLKEQKSEIFQVK